LHTSTSLKSYSSPAGMCMSTPTLEPWFTMFDSDPISTANRYIASPEHVLRCSRSRPCTLWVSAFTYHARFLECNYCQLCTSHALLEVTISPNNYRRYILRTIISNLCPYNIGSFALFKNVASKIMSLLARGNLHVFNSYGFVVL
jgi:hypothetical protein